MLFLYLKVYTVNFTLYLSFFQNVTKYHNFRNVTIDILTQVINCAINLNKLKEILNRTSWKLWFK